MKTQKMIVIGAIVCLLMGPSGAAMAEPSNCQLGFIANETVDGIFIEEPQNCYISDVLVLGDVTIRNGGEVIIRASRVFGSVQIVDSSDVGLFGNEVVNGDVLVIRPRVAYIANNRLIKAGSMGMVIQEVGVNNIDPDTGERLGEALIFDNTVQRGVIQCIDVDGLAFARSNIALAIIGCPGQLMD